MSALHQQLIANEIGTWAPDRRDEFYERAAIIEFDGKQPRANAELMAFQQMKKAKK